ncbi:MAG TPA: type II secretion system F family protein [Candidatus Aquicultoraceae bacterium]|nr:type II secretion system F family protein [Candidatus Aquicultoraceae bacterium]
MRILDLLSIGIPALAGSLLVAGSFRKSPLLRSLARVPGKIATAHKNAQSILVGSKVLAVPGGCLVTSLRGWLAGEAVWIAVVALSQAFSPGVSGAAFSIVLGAVPALLTVYLCLRRESNQQLERIRSALPMASFLLSLLLEAGTGSHAALREVAAAIPRGPLAAELDDLSRARMLGISREDALERSRGRVPLEEYHAFLNLVRQGEHLGVGLSRGLAEHSMAMLEREGFRAEEKAQKAAVKLLFPLVVFIFPAVALIIFSPIVLGLWELWGS